MDFDSRFVFISIFVNCVIFVFVEVFIWSGSLVWLLDLDDMVEFRVYGVNNI